MPVSAATGRTRLAYRHCESLTRGAAINFYYGIGLLPADKRRAMCAVYAFARRVDDVGDGTLPPEEKLLRLAALERGLRELATSDPDPVMTALADAHIRFGLPLEALGDLIEGVRMDVTGTFYASFAELEIYCRRVAGSIGRLCLAIFGTRPADPARASAVGGSVADGSGATEPKASAGELADALGVAMQLTNIVRDLHEDARGGRVYLPARDLVRYHLHDDGPLDARALAALAREGRVAEPSVVAGFGGEDVGQLYALMRFQCLRARDWFHRGLELLGLLDRRSAACVLTMAGIYLRLLRHIEDRPDQALAGCISLKSHEKAWVAGRALVGRGVPERHPAERLLEEHQ